MEQCDHWYADGTFNSAPPLFSQIYTIHGVRYSNVIPTVFALLTNKTQETYTRVFQQLKVLNPALRPLTIMMDFEKAAMNAAQTEFPNVRIRGCFFHFSQCMWRHIQSAGLQRRYIENPDFALHLRQLTNVLKIEQYISGNVPPRKRKYQDTANRIRAIVADYADRPTLEYLRGIAHNFQLQT
ncbi:uncharacterized protein [Diabrotica undecimpunctata]|uniref:uncharacterized protein n=1 Tax=Diabrotica undecimpunctata TaxID=50387 RepID=UPI003B634612